MASIQDVQLLLNSNKEISDFGKPASSQSIRRAEEFLSLGFPVDYRDYLMRWSWLSIGPNEYFGIISENFESASHQNAIGFTQMCRRERSYPNHLIVVRNNEGDELHSLDTTDPDASRIVVWDTNLRKITAVRADSLFEYILKEATDFLD